MKAPKLNLDSPTVSGLYGLDHQEAEMISTKVVELVKKHRGEHGTIRSKLYESFHHDVEYLMFAFHRYDQQCGIESVLKVMDNAMNTGFLNGETPDLVVVSKKGDIGNYWMRYTVEDKDGPGLQVSSGGEHTVLKNREEGITALGFKAGKGEAKRVSINLSANNIPEALGLDPEYMSEYVSRIMSEVINREKENDPDITDEEPTIEAVQRLIEKVGPARLTAKVLAQGDNAEQQILLMNAVTGLVNSGTQISHGVIDLKKLRDEFENMPKHALLRLAKELMNAMNAKS